MTTVYVLSYLMMGLVVAKFFQRWMNKTAFALDDVIDMPGFFTFILVWPACVIVRVIAWLIQLWAWFFHLWENKK